jgi:hypothetical protein
MENQTKGVDPRTTSPNTGYGAGRRCRQGIRIAQGTPEVFGQGASPMATGRGPPTY